MSMHRFLLIIFTVFILIACKTQPEVIEKLEEAVEVIEIIEAIEVIDFIEIKEPEFEVESIYILQADIVVTEFEAVLRIKNPNDFAIELSSITYELYGNGEFWAEGITRNILQIPAQSSSETSFVFSMNFINMNRRLLDDVIAMRQINYRFKGQAQMKPVIQDIPIGKFIANTFNVDFDCSGRSQVRRRAR